MLDRSNRKGLQELLIGTSFEAYDSYYTSFRIHRVENVQMDDVGRIYLQDESGHSYSIEFCRKPQSPANEKSPLELKLQKLFLESRLLEIKEAMRRYVNINKELPLEWVKEYNELTNKLERM